MKLLISIVLLLFASPVLAEPTQHPLVWANDYCVYVGTGATRAEAEALATAATGEPTPEAWRLVNENTTWCPYEAN